jgi:aspartokinase
MFELASLGTQVLQPRSIEFAMKFGVPIHVRSSFSDKEGTIILLAPCKEGISSNEIFQKMLLENHSSDHLFELIEKGELPGESCVLYLFSKVKQNRIIIVSDGLSQSEVMQMGLEFAPTLDSAIQSITDQNPEVIWLKTSRSTRWFAKNRDDFNGAGQVCQALADERYADKSQQKVINSSQGENALTSFFLSIGSFWIGKGIPIIGHPGDRFLSFFQ